MLRHWDRRLSIQSLFIPCNQLFPDARLILVVLEHFIPHHLIVCLNPRPRRIRNGRAPAQPSHHNLVNALLDIALFDGHPRLGDRRQHRPVDVQTHNVDEADNDDGDDVRRRDDPDVVPLRVDDGPLDGVARGDEQQAAEDEVEDQVDGPVKDAQEEVAVRHGDARREAAQLIRRRPADSDKEYNRGRMATAGRAAGDAFGAL